MNTLNKDQMISTVGILTEHKFTKGQIEAHLRNIVAIEVGEKDVKMALNPNFELVENVIVKAIMQAIQMKPFHDGFMVYYYLPYLGHRIAMNYFSEQ